MCAYANSSAITVWGIYPTEILAQVGKTTHTRIFTAVITNNRDLENDYIQMMTDDVASGVRQAFPGGPVVKNPPAKAGDTGSIPGPRRSHMPLGK